MDAVVARLVQLQGKRTDTEMAALLGVSKGQWSHIKAGRRNLTRERIAHAVRAFGAEWPELAADIAGQEQVA